MRIGPGRFAIRAVVYLSTAKKINRHEPRYKAWRASYQMNTQTTNNYYIMTTINKTSSELKNGVKINDIEPIIPASEDNIGRLAMWSRDGVRPCHGLIVSVHVMPNGAKVYGFVYAYGDTWVSRLVYANHVTMCETEDDVRMSDESASRYIYLETESMMSHRNMETTEAGRDMAQKRINDVMSLSRYLTTVII